MNYAVAEWSAAWQKADVTIESTLFWTQETRPFSPFTVLQLGMERCVHTGNPTCPVERTLLTSGMLDATLVSKSKHGQWIDTPYLKIAYQSNWNWRQPPWQP